MTPQEIFSDNYLPAFWYAYGISNDDMRVATDFANHYALEQMEGSTPHTGIPEAFTKWCLANPENFQKWVESH